MTMHECFNRGKVKKKRTSDDGPRYCCRGGTGARGARPFARGSGRRGRGLAHDVRAAGMRGRRAQRSADRAPLRGLDGCRHQPLRRRQNRPKRHKPSSSTTAASETTAGERVAGGGALAFSTQDDGWKSRCLPIC